MKMIFILSFADSGLIGVYSTAKKAVAGAVDQFKRNNLSASTSQITVAIKSLRSGESSYRLIALEAENQYDETKTLIIDRWNVQ